MKKLFLTIALAGFVAAPLAFAEDAATNPAPASGAAAPAQEGHRNYNPEERLKKMKETLSLTDDQVTKIKAIFAADADKMKALRDDSSLSQDDRRSKFQELRKGQQEQINAVLTPDQQTKWKEEMEKRRAARSGNSQ